ncbi:MAG: hypothetical protein BWY02_02964 [bacterium ADurb.Bin157]|nr:MAG: hypothetical protein BWY02_02964 [bacterium ADurb.Bin157]
MTELKYYNLNGKCTATKDHLCRYFKQDPFNRRYQICFYRQEGKCKHAMDLVCQLNGGEGWETNDLELVIFLLFNWVD